jgi:ribosomal-protein-alanine N-acetyltransferase
MENLRAALREERRVGMSTNRTEKEQLRVHIRWMIRRDMPEVLGTEQESFEFPWTEEDFLRCLRQRNCIGMVAEQGEKVVGFMIYELHKAKLHILNFAVHPGCRRSGVGAQMVAKLISKLSSHRRTRITLEVRETNLAAQLFYRSQGFKAVRVLRNFYEDTGEDAYLLQYRLPEDVGEDVEETVNRIAQYEES